MTYGPYPGIVERVVDGDTAYVKLDVGFDLTIYARCRIFGINAPEINTAAGVEAKKFAQTLLPIGSDVTVVSHGWDKYGGRIDADIEISIAAVPGAVSTRDFATLMLDSGHAVRMA